MSKTSWIFELIRTAAAIIIFLVGTILLIDINLAATIVCGVMILIMTWWLDTYLV